VSIQIKNFQDQFNIPLTEVIGRKLHITDFDMEIYKMATHLAKGKKLSPVAKAFIEFVKEHKETIEKKHFRTVKH
jgi:hypothetical protein